MTEVKITISNKKQLAKLLRKIITQASSSGSFYGEIEAFRSSLWTLINALEILDD